MKKIKVYEVYLFEGAIPYIDNDILLILSDIQNADIGTEIKIKIKEMEKNKFESLPDFQGP